MIFNFFAERIDGLVPFAQAFLRSILINRVDTRRRSQPYRQPRSEDYSGLQLRKRIFSSSVSGEPSDG